MKKRITIIFINIAAIFLLNGCSFLGYEKISKEEEERIINKAKNAKLIVLDVYHNNCSSCKLIEPAIKKLESTHSQNKDVVFLKYDLSNPFTVISSRRIAKELGLENIYKAQKYSGVVLTIDLKNKKILDTLVNEYNTSTYNSVIAKRLKVL